uniref:Methyltransferase n=1 Tax=Leersia perrieri TaxID=77586 RepID=A0A0D9WLA5_9ORYZ
MKKLPLPAMAAVVALCVASYLLAVWTHPPPPLLPSAASLAAVPCTTRQQSPPPPSSAATATAISNATVLDFSIHHGASDADEASPSPPSRRVVPACGAGESELTPCEGQRAPPRWPASRDAAWYANAPHGELVAEKGVQNWVRKDGDLLRFPGGGTMFPHGAGKYIDDIAAAGGVRLGGGGGGGGGGEVRTALDTGCGVASWGAYLLSRDVLAMSFAPKDTHEAQVLFALERGVPAMLGIMATKRLPYPARAFDMAHCSRCLIPWSKFNGLYMIEVDRVLRPGGYWVLSGPPVNWERHFKGWKRTPEDLSSEQSTIEAIAKSLCWTKVQQMGDIAVWKKPINHVNCKASRNELGSLGFCNASSQDPDAGWYVNMEECITPLPEVSGPGEVAGGELKRWPERLTSPLPRIAGGSLGSSITVETFNKDSELWRRRVDRYKGVSSRLAEKGRYRNLLDMNAGLGGFAAALIDDPVWVMNVVPTAAIANTLGVIYERGLIGTYQDWCEAMSTYPRSYDLIHAYSLFTMYKDRCEMEDILIEIDRVLRPEGTVIFRDDIDILVKIKNIADGMRWESRIVDHEDGPKQREKILVSVKSYWTA